VNPESGLFVDRAHCPVCGATGSTLYRSKFAEDPIRSYLERFYAPQGNFEIDELGTAEYVLVQCPRCELIYQRHVPSERLMRKLYDEWLDPNSVADIDASARDSRYFTQIAQDALTMLAHLPPGSKPPTVLDFGLGWGDWARMMVALGCDSYGFDISASRVAAAGRFGVSPITYAEIREGSFDIINADQVFEHLAEPVATLKHLATGLSPGGYISIRVPKARTILAAIERGDWMAPKGSKHSLNPVAPLEHINCFSHQGLVELGAQAGLVERRLGLGRQYANTVGWQANSKLLRQIGAPVYRSLTKRSAWVLLAHPAATG
jgi:2-polyprenyl-3-methyl-5-hydroxy-6-metoxy-1,4-benzoquinol methylase